ncbi:hypothetical protein BKG67_23035 [Mycobacteroides chelonae]|nr:hypothetical protein BKG66_24500 [Mycobacteroides chelonae]OHT69432.1 hypothetical protein BKG67_23035 [Mycobacteroides chelonae]
MKGQLMPNRIQAVELSGEHIDEVVQFGWSFSSGVEANVRGELRQIYHASDNVTVNLSDPTGSTGSLTEFQLDLDEEVIVE